MKPLVCVDCKWHIAHPSSTETTNLDKCKASEAVNIVTGKPTFKYCESMRSSIGDCGIDAKLFDLNVGEQDQGGEDPFHTH